MKTFNLAFRNARRQVSGYVGESKDVMRRHAEAMDCWDCEDVLQLGIDAFDWLNRADEAIRRDINSGRLEYDPRIDRALKSLYARWLKPCPFAEQWIAVQEARGFTVRNAARFRVCCEEARAIVDDDDVLDNDAIVELRDEAIDAYRKGETVEFGESA